MGKTDQAGHSHLIINEWGRTLGSQTGEGGLGHPQAIYMSPKLFLLLACLKFPLGDNIPKILF
jgi:hypothetical protein